MCCVFERGDGETRKPECIHMGKFRERRNCRSFWHLVEKKVAGFENKSCPLDIFRGRVLMFRATSDSPLAASLVQIYLHCGLSSLTETSLIFRAIHSVTVS